MKYKKLFLLIIIFGLGAFFRLYHIEFGLPHTFYADEPEIAELAIKYTYELRSIIATKDFYKLIPISYVYGTVPAYLNTALTMLFSKSIKLLQIPFEKWHIYVFLRTINALSGLGIVWATYALALKLFKSWPAAVISAFLLAFNWKLIVHAHYINADILQTLFLTLSYLTMYFYFLRTSDTKFTVLSGILYGLAVGTKITTLFSLPLFAFVFIYKKEYRNLFAFLFIIFGTFLATNPFSFIFATNFAFRIYTMFTKEAGLVFDSVNSSYLKYILALANIITLPVLALSLYGKTKSVKAKGESLAFHIFLISNALLYLLFFSVQSRLVDRWLLPIVPLGLMYAGYGIMLFKEKVTPAVFALVGIIILVWYLYFPLLLLGQFQRYTPKAQAYLWMQENLNPALNKLAYTEEGLDPINKLPGARVIKVEVYEDEAAQFLVPEDTSGYDYVILSSRPLENYKKPEIKEKYPFYYDKWNEFEQTLLDENQYKLLKEFTLSKPNLIPLSDVFIYQNLNPIRTQY